MKVDELLEGLLLASVGSSQAPSHSQSVSVLCSHWVIQYCPGSLCECGGVSSPGDSGSRPASGDTCEGEL